MTDRLEELQRHLQENAETEAAHAGHRLEMVLTVEKREVKRRTLEELDRVLKTIAIEGDSGLERAQSELSEIFKLCVELQLAVDNGVDEEFDLRLVCQINMTILRLLSARMAATFAASKYHTPEQRLKFSQNYYSEVKAQARQIPPSYNPIYDPDVLSKLVAVDHAAATRVTSAMPKPKGQGTKSEEPSSSTGNRNPPIYPGKDARKDNMRFSWGSR